MKLLFKPLVYLSAALALFSCKDEVIEKPDNLVPITLTIEEINTGKYINQTVKIENAYFEVLPGTKFNGTSSNGSGNKTLRDCNGDALIVFTYTSDDWSYELVPTKMGPIYGVVTEFNGTIQLRLRSIDDVKEMTKDKCAEIFTIATIPQILNGDFSSGEIVKIEGVQFQDGTPDWGGPNTIEDCFGNTLTTYVAGAESFANNPVPTGNGAIIGTLDLFNTTWEIKPRSESDGAGMINARCTSGGGSGCSGGYFCDDFEGGSLTGNNAWVVKEVANPDAINSWVLGTQGGNYAKASNFVGSANHTADWWLISPAIDLSGSTAPKLSFDNVTRYTGPAMKVLISTNYDGSSAPSSATWTDITSLFTLDTDDSSWTLVPAGSGDITAHKSATTYIAFQYTGSTSDGSTWEVDNVQIKE